MDVREKQMQHMQERIIFLEALLEMNERTIEKLTETNNILVKELFRTDKDSREQYKYPPLKIENANDRFLQNQFEDARNRN